MNRSISVTASCAVCRSWSGWGLRGRLKAGAALNSPDSGGGGDAAAPVGAYLIFLRWSPGEPRIVGHLESDFLARARTEEEARTAIGALSLTEAKRVLDGLIRASRTDSAERAWWDVMRDENEGP